MSSVIPLPRNDGIVELFTAPVMLGARYEDKPIYYSDVLVRRDSPYLTFNDLRGARWVFNEPGSFSGYFIMDQYLTSIGETLNYFGELIESGAHSASIQMVLEGRADTAAIDSTVFDQLIRLQPELRDHFRVVECLGPYPIPPWVVSMKTPIGARKVLRETMLAMRGDSSGQSILEKAGVARFVEVADEDYDPIRTVVRAGVALP
jgi:phosphonate transport system substrate-binding protein